MNGMPALAASVDGAGKRLAVVASRFHADLADRLVAGAMGCLTRHGVAPQDVRMVRVHGAWEIPLALEELAAAGGVDALVALGVVIRGETAHFDYICAESSRGVAAVALRHRIPVGFGILTCETCAQAEERAGGKLGNKGEEAALAALEMANLLQFLRREGAAL